MKMTGTTFLTVLLSSAAWADAPKSTPALLEKGQKSYATNCLACHGEKGDGQGPTGVYLNPKPRNFTAEPFKQGEKPEEIFATITKGVPGSTMVAFSQLPEEERWALTYYVGTFRPQPAKAVKPAKGTKGAAKKPKK